MIIIEPKKNHLYQYQNWIKNDIKYNNFVSIYIYQNWIKMSIIEPNFAMYKY